MLTIGHCPSSLLFVPLWEARASRSVVEGLSTQALESDLGLQLSSGIYTLGKIGHVF